jgi:hypothetical protein
MTKINKTAAIFFYTDSRYDELSNAAISSFKKWNPEVDVFIINETNKKEWDSKLIHYEAGDELFIMQYIYAHHIMAEMGYNKIISLGCDTITCARLDEFLDDNKTDILCSLNYAKPEGTEYWQNPIETFPEGFQDTPNINADVVCFNNVDALKHIIDLSIEHYTYFSIQGGLNEAYYKLGEHLFTINIVDYPYHKKQVVYNARSKGVIFTNQISGNPNSPLKHFRVKDNKLFTVDGKQVKVFHYIEGLGGRPLESFNQLINEFKNEWFNEETRDFFAKQCNCREFFNIWD